jgi:anti-sigma-K factor RskA
MMHDEMNDLLASFALDAVEPLERHVVELHLAECPRCSAELDAMREVAAALGNSVEPLPQNLWAKISSRLPDRQDDAFPPMPNLLRAVRSEERVTPGRAQPRRSSRRWRAATALVAAAAASAALGVALVRNDGQGTDGQASTRAATSEVVSALETPGHQVVNLESADHVRLAQFVVANGRGFLVSSSLPTLSSGETYQLWGLIGSQPISLGLLGRSPSESVFTVGVAPSPTELSVTVEPAGGSVVPTSPMVATGTV